MDLTKLLKPKSVAVIGASEKNGFGGDVCRNIMTYVKDRSRVYFIHPKRETVFGETCYKSISQVPTDVDLMVICTSQKTVIPAAALWYSPAVTGRWARRKDAKTRRS